MGKVKAIAIATLTALILNTSCYREVSKQTYVGTVIDKEYHVWKNFDDYEPSFKFKIKTEEGIKEFDITCPPIKRDGYEIDKQDEIKPYSSDEFKANENIKVGDNLGVTVTKRESQIFYICPEIKYQKKLINEK